MRFYDTAGGQPAEFRVYSLWQITEFDIEQLIFSFRIESTVSGPFAPEEGMNASTWDDRMMGLAACPRRTSGNRPYV